MQTDKKDNCLNCGSFLQGNFCSHCGQSARAGRITFKETLKIFLSSTFSLEGPLLLTIHHLIVKPGNVFRAFIEGKRKTYYQPVTFYVLLTALYLIMRALLRYDPLEGQIGFADLETSAFVHKTKEAARFMVDNINNILFFLVFSLALMLKLFFRKQYNLAEYTSIGLFITGTYLLFGILMMFIGTLFSTGGSKFQLLVMMLLISYSSASLFKRFDVWSIVKYVFVGLFSLLLYMVLGFGFSFLVVLWR